MSKPPTELDQRIRQAVFAHVRKLVAKKGFLTKKQLRQKLSSSVCGGKRFSLIHPQWAGYKPKQMSHLLSLLSTRRGSVIYDIPIPEPPTQGDVDSTDYLLIKGQSPDYFRNRYLRDAGAHGVPILFFLEIDRQCFVPTRAIIKSWKPKERRVELVFSSLDSSVENLDDATNDLNHRYDSNHRFIVAKRKQRLHQYQFRRDLIKAYGGRCAISGLSVPELLEAAHIIPDYHVDSQPIVSNGLLLSKIHHAAFDANLIGITGAYHVKVSKRLLQQDSGSSDLLTLWKKINNKRIRFLPRREKDWPNEKFLKKRYKEFQAADKN